MDEESQEPIGLAENDEAAQALNQPLLWGVVLRQGHPAPAGRAALLVVRFVFVIRKVPSSLISLCGFCGGSGSVVHDGLLHAREGGRNQSQRRRNEDTRKDLAHWVPGREVTEPNLRNEREEPVRSMYTENSSLLE